MALLPSLGRAVGTGLRTVRLMLRGSLRGSVWATRRVGAARAKSAAGEAGMVRLFDLHALSCAGDTLIAIGLAGTIFFNVPLGEARSKVALYLLVTMVPFALLAPVVGPLLDHFRHGRRYALAATMLGRAFLAWLISDHLDTLGLYPAAFGVLALSRAYGVARSAAVPRLLPEGVGLSQVGARASVYGTFAGAAVAPIGLAAFWFGPQWPLRVASIIFLTGMVVSLRLPPRADSDPPEAVPRPFRAALRLRRGTDRPLSGPLVVAALVGSASFRCLYGFLLLYLAFAIKAGQLDTAIVGRDIGSQGAVALIGGALAVGTFLATAVGTRLRIRRPVAVQSSGLTITAGVAVLAVVFFSLPMVALLCLVTAVFSGLSKLAVDASIQERVPERLRASAFAHSETVLMLAWVVGGAVGIIPLADRFGIGLAAAVAVAAAVRAALAAKRLRAERLHGRPDVPVEDPAASDADAQASPTEPAPTQPASTQPAPTQAASTRPTPTRPGPSGPASTRSGPPRPASAQPASAQPAPAQPSPARPASAQPSSAQPASAQPSPAGAAPATADRGKRLRFWPARRKPDPAPAAASEDAWADVAADMPADVAADVPRARPGDPARRAARPRTTPVEPTEQSTRDEPAAAPPGFHIYRPSSATHGGPPGDGPHHGPSGPSA